MISEELRNEAHKPLWRIRTRAVGIGMSDKMSDSRVADAAPSTDLRGHTGGFEGRGQTSLAPMAWKRSGGWGLRLVGRLSRPNLPDR